MGLIFAYAPTLALLVLGGLGLRDAVLLNKRGVRAEGQRGGTSWNGNIPSVDVIYRDGDGVEHYVTVAAEELGVSSPDSPVPVVYDPLKVDRAMTEKVLHAPKWKTMDGYMVMVGLGLAIIVTVGIAAIYA
ncbi:hypothetical protein AB0G32_03910 [Streptomyces sp. NPDC023723]|uniref:hypothetical protein n=1 Tax=Streptomyces sp. NPDC023723 TaxID=3154323 RepID=UPI00340B8F24